MDPKDLLENLVCLVCLEPTEYLVILARKDHLETKVIMDHLDNWDHSVILVHVVLKVILDQQAKKDLMERKVKRR